MIQRVEAIYEHGVFRPQRPLDMPEGQRVRLDIEASDRSADPGGLDGLIDVAFTHACRETHGPAPSLKEVRDTLAQVQASISDLISQERNER